MNSHKKPAKTTPQDVAAYLIDLSNEIGEPLTNMKLQKLLYYTYAWFAVEKNKPLFEETIKALKYGPVVMSIYEEYKSCGADVIKDKKSGNPNNLDEFTKLLTEDVFQIYGDKTAIDLMRLTHSEAPWRDTFRPDAGVTEIPFKKIRDYYVFRSRSK